MRLDRVLAAQLERLSAEFAGAGTEQGDGADEVLMKDQNLTADERG